MDAGGTITVGSREIDLTVVDCVLALAFTVGALVDLGSQPAGDRGVLAIASLLVVGVSLACRRASPLLAAAAVAVAFAAFELVSRYRGDGAFEVAAVAVSFYTVGRAAPSGWLWLAGLFVIWLGCSMVVTHESHSGPFASALGPWILFGVVPYAAGHVLAARTTLTRRLRHAAARLREEQEVSARTAAALERSRMARELHDVIAHCVSVMVVQTGGARRVAPSDPATADAALSAVERTGREALVELRRLVGVLRRDDDDAADFAGPRLSRLTELVERFREAGLDIDLRVSGSTAALSPEVDLVAFRVIQEALTNTIKHAGPSDVSVSVSAGTDVLELDVANGRPAAPVTPLGDSAGRGLVGMRERVRLHGGVLRAGPRSDGGFEVSARIPLREPPAPVAAAAPKQARAIPLRWLDPALACVVLLAAEASVLSSESRRGPLAVGVIVAAALALAVVWRRRRPLMYVLAVAILGSVCDGYLLRFTHSPAIAAYVLLVPAFTAAAWLELRGALLGLALMFAAASVSELVIRHDTVGNFAGVALTIVGAWAAGRGLGARRVLNRRLEHTSARLTLEKESRTRLAVSAERSRIARELHAALAGPVSGMVVQAEAASTLLRRDAPGADAAMDTIERTGREVSQEMRRILGVLRHDGTSGELAPRPGVAQLYGLIERARERGQAIDLEVEGDPGVLPAGVDLGLYRIVEDALDSADGAAVRIAIRFGERELEVDLAIRDPGPRRWPTIAMRQRVALCGGEIADADSGRRVRARIPRALPGAFA